MLIHSIVVVISIIIDERVIFLSESIGFVARWCRQWGIIVQIGSLTKSVILPSISWVKSVIIVIIYCSSLIMNRSHIRVIVVCVDFPLIDGVCVS